MTAKFKMYTLKEVTKIRGEAPDYLVSHQISRAVCVCVCMYRYQSSEKWQYI